MSIWYQFAGGGGEGGSLQCKQISIDWRLFLPPNSISPSKYLNYTREPRNKNRVEKLK